MHGYYLENVDDTLDGLAAVYQIRNVTRTPYYSSSRDIDGEDAQLVVVKYFAPWESNFLIFRRKAQVRRDHLMSKDEVTWFFLTRD